MNNLFTADPAPIILSRPLARVLDRLDALLLVLKSCKGSTCAHPWKALHPEGNVGSLADALKCAYDGFYAAQPKVQFQVCAGGYLVELEGPMEYNVYGR
jgi:N-acetylglucosamine-6-sulfatase